MTAFDIGDSVLLGDEEYCHDNPVMTVIAVKAGEIQCGWFSGEKIYQKAWFPTDSLDRLNVEEEETEAEEAED